MARTKQKPAPKARARKEPSASVPDAPTTSRRPIWKGAITFGLITIPVGLYTAVEERDVSFHMLAPDGSRVRYKRVSSKTGEEVPYGEIRKGYEYEKDRYVVFTEEELDAVPSDSIRAIDVVSFVDREEIDPLYFQSAYYAAPEETGVKAYALLTEALERAGKVGVAKVTIRQKERLATLRPKEGVLVLETMHWPDEVRTPAFEQLERAPDVRPQELQMAESLIENLAGEFRPEEFRDTYRERLEEAIRAKIEGEEVQLATEEPAREEVADLMAALKASVEAAREKRKAAGRQSA